MPHLRADRPIILGVVGDSASGKTTLSAGVAQILGGENVAVVGADDYHRHSRRERAAIGISALDPRSSYMDILEQHLRLLRRGEPVLKPVYDHGTGTLSAPEYVAPRPYIIVEGLLGYTTRAMRDCFDVKVYLEPDENLRIRWKLQRDCGTRGYTRDQVLEELERRKQDSPAYIHPQRTFADIVVHFHPPRDHLEETGARLNVRHILRPTLPHPDLSPILDTSVKNGLHLELSRDKDGKPVDVLDIYGNIDDTRAQRIEDLLWELIPEASHLRTNVGQFTDDHNEPVQSHPLALTQLLIAYHMVKAALGVHAV